MAIHTPNRPAAVNTKLRFSASDSLPAVDVPVLLGLTVPPVDVVAPVPAPLDPAVVPVAGLVACTTMPVTAVVSVEVYVVDVKPHCDMILSISKRFSA